MNFRLAWMLLTAEDDEVLDAAEGLALARRAAELDPDSDAILDTLATALFQTGDPLAAARIEARAFGGGPTLQLSSSGGNVVIRSR